MPILTDLGRVRSRLARDPAWSAYALGDLSPRFAQWAEWHSSADDEAVVLAYRQFGTPIVFTIGPPAAVQPLFAEIPDPAITLQVRPEILPVLAPVFTVQTSDPMWRMVWQPALFQPPALTAVEVLGPGDAADVRRLYADGDAAGEAPDFFAVDMLAAGLFRGVRREGALVAVAGTHIVAADMGICAIGNVYTRRDFRGQGLGARVTAAVVVAARAQGIPTIVLNVRHRNAAARRVYERLGFVAHTDFFEGTARRAVGDRPAFDR